MERRPVLSGGILGTDQTSFELPRCSALRQHLDPNVYLFVTEREPRTALTASSNFGPGGVPPKSTSTSRQRPEKSNEPCASASPRGTRRMLLWEKGQVIERNLIRRRLSRPLPADESTGKGGHDRVLRRHRFDRVLLAGREFGPDWSKLEVRRLENGGTEDASFHPVRHVDRHALVLQSGTGAACLAGPSGLTIDRCPARGGDQKCGGKQRDVRDTPCHACSRKYVVCSLEGPSVRPSSTDPDSPRSGRSEDPLPTADPPARARRRLADRVVRGRLTTERGSQRSVHPGRRVRASASPRGGDRFRRQLPSRSLPPSKRAMKSCPIAAHRPCFRRRRAAISSISANRSARGTPGCSSSARVLSDGFDQRSGAIFSSIWAALLQEVGSSAERRRWAATRQAVEQNFRSAREGPRRRRQFSQRRSIATVTVSSLARRRPSASVPAPLRGSFWPRFRNSRCVVSFSSGPPHALST